MTIESLAKQTIEWWLADFTRRGVAFDLETVIRVECKTWGGMPEAEIERVLREAAKEIA
jgi:hypothetical protein